MVTSSGHSHTDRPDTAPSNWAWVNRPWPNSVSWLRCTIASTPAQRTLREADNAIPAEAQLLAGGKGGPAQATRRQQPSRRGDGRGTAEGASSVPRPHAGAQWRVNSHPLGCEVVGAASRARCERVGGSPPAQAGGGVG